MTLWHWWMRLTDQQHGRLGFLFSVQGRWYGIGSGWGLAYATPVLYLKHQNCHERRCWRLGLFKHTTPDGHHSQWCRRHMHRVGGDPHAR